VEYNEGIENLAQQSYPQVALLKQIKGVGTLIALTFLLTLEDPHRFRKSRDVELTSWVGTCPGKDESAEQNHSSRSAKGNKYLRRVLNQAAHAAVKKRGSYFQAVFRRLLPRLGYQSAIWAIAHRLCRVVWKIFHEGARFIEQGNQPDAQAKKKRARILVQALRRLGYDIAITETHLAMQNAVQV